MTSLASVRRHQLRFSCCKGIRLALLYLFIGCSPALGALVSVIDSPTTVTQQVPLHQSTSEAAQPNPEVGPRPTSACAGWWLNAISVSLSEKKKQQLSKADTGSMNCGSASTNVTKLTIKLDSLTSENFTSTSWNSSCAEFSSTAYQTVTDVTVVGRKLIDHDHATARMCTCLPEVDKVTLKQAMIGGLTGNMIDVIACDRLQELHLSDNGITNVESETFDGRRHGGVLGRRLRVLDLSRNAITSIENASFVDLFALRIVNLSYNAVYRLERATFLTSEFYHL